VKKRRKEAKTTIIFASKRNEAKQTRNFVRFDAKKVFFRLFSHLKRNENEMKQKRNEKDAKICKETKKNINFGLLVFQVYS
jgi:hypothetical protein